TKLVEPSLVNAMGISVAQTSLNLNVTAIIAATESDSKARTISEYRTHSYTIAWNPSEESASEGSIVWGFQQVVKKGRGSTDALINNAVATAVETGRVTK
ncbi:pyruvate kinase, partial [Staphylococcus aureus]